MVDGSIEPVVPDHPAVAAEAEEVLLAAGRLGAQLHPVTAQAVAALLRTVNSYYSNLIEGHDTHPVEIERAMRHEYAAGSEARNLQLEAAAHIEVQLLIEGRLAASPGTNVCAPDFICWIHREFYDRLPGALRIVRNRDGSREVEIVPGALRTYDVQVGTHVAPAHADLTHLLDRYARVYDPAGRSQREALILLGAAHHRLLWIHPFGDGNGRVARLITDAYLKRVGVGGHGLWTAARGLARSGTRYREALAAADAPRWNDYDGRGALSHQALVAFARFFLEICLDQIGYMEGLLRVDRLAERAESYGRAREAGLLAGPEGTGTFRPEATRLLKQMIYRGAIPRGEVRELLNLEERTARRVVRALTDEGFVTSTTSRAPITLRIPAHAGPYLMPGIYRTVGSVRTVGTVG